MQAAIMAKLSSRLKVGFLISNSDSKWTGGTTHVPHIVIGIAVSWISISQWHKYGTSACGPYKKNPSSGSNREAVST